MRISLHLLGSEHENKTHIKCCMALKDHECIGFVFVTKKKKKDPQLSHMAAVPITQGGIGGLGSLVHICGNYSTGSW